MALDHVERAFEKTAKAEKASKMADVQPACHPQSGLLGRIYDSLQLIGPTAQLDHELANNFGSSFASIARIFAIDSSVACSPTTAISSARENVVYRDLAGFNAACDWICDDVNSPRYNRTSEILPRK
jgi:hypothetical protein